MTNDTDLLAPAGPEPLESGVAHLFSYTLGFVAGWSAPERDRGASPSMPSLDLNGPGAVNAFLFAGGKLDSEVGDALLNSGTQWYLLELKRDYNALRSEFAKERVQNLKSKLEPNRPISEAIRFLSAATTAHQFLYLCNTRGNPHPVLVALGYLDWLATSPAPVKNKHATGDELDPVFKYATDHSVPFIDFLRKVESGSFAGFSAAELSQYIEFMNSSDGDESIPNDVRLEDQKWFLAVDKDRSIQAFQHDAVLKVLKSRRVDTRPRSDGQP